MRTTRLGITTCLTAIAMSTCVTRAEDHGEPVDCSTYAVELGAVDVERSAIFYVQHFGFERTGPATPTDLVTLKNGSTTLLLRRTPRVLRAEPESACVHINFMVDDLSAAIKRLGARGVTFPDPTPRKFVLGRSVVFDDPDGNVHHLLELDQPRRAVTSIPRIFNVSVTATDIDEAESFYAGSLGFDVFSRDYLPDTLPLNKKGTFPIVIHGRATKPARESTDAFFPRIVFTADDFETSVARLRRSNVHILSPEPASPVRGASTLFSDRSGVVHRLLKRASSEHSKPVATVAQLQWMAGRWTASINGDYLEETWSAPAGDCLIGMFRWLRGDEVWMYEFMSIRQEDGGPVFRLKHFGEEMKGWEPKDQAMTYPLTELRDGEAVFENPDRDHPRRFIYRKTSDRELLIRLEGYDKDGHPGADEFRFSLMAD